MNNDMSWGAPFVRAPEPMKLGLSLDHMWKHVTEWTALSQRRGYHTGLSTQVHRLLLQEPLDRLIELLDQKHDDPAGKQVNLYYCGPTRALWTIQYISIMSGCFNSYGVLSGRKWREARAEAIRLATEYPDMASNGIHNPNQREMDAVLVALDLPKRAAGRMTDATCIYCA